MKNLSAERSLQLTRACCIEEKRALQESLSAERHSTVADEELVAIKEESLERTFPLNSLGLDECILPAMNESRKKEALQKHFFAAEIMH